MKSKYYRVVKSRAQKHGHSLQAEVKSILQQLTVAKTEEVKLFADEITA